MNFNKIIFPAPRPSYSKEKLFGEIIYVPRKFHIDAELNKQSYAQSFKGSEKVNPA